MQKIKKLEAFTQAGLTTFTESEIIDWISECVNVFYEVGVDSIMIRSFLDHFSSKTEKRKFRQMMGEDVEEIVNTIGPFHEEIEKGIFSYKTGRYILSGSFYYSKVAFSSAKNALKNKIEEKRLVPLWLIKQISEIESIKHIASSLELIQAKYESSDAHGLVTESVTLLDNVLNLDPELKTKNALGGKLSTLIDDKTKLARYGVSKDLVIGLNCGRLLRNAKIIHKQKPIKYEFPLLIATNFAYLVLFFTECAILNEKIVTYSNE